METTDLAAQVRKEHKKRSGTTAATAGVCSRRFLRKKYRQYSSDRKEQRYPEVAENKKRYRFYQAHY